MESNAARILNELNNLDYERRGNAPYTFNGALSKLTADDSSLLQGPYLNASYIPAFPGSIEGSLACIVSQAPTPSTFQAFFHHLHAQKVNVLVNLTPLEEGGMVKSDQYWPTTPTSPLHFADNALKISLLPDAPSGLPLLQNLAYRSLQISNVKENWSHTVTLLHYTGWKDHGVLDISMMLFLLRAVTEAQKKAPASAPIWVHCSAGIGRSGTLIGAYLAQQVTPTRHGANSLNFAADITKYMRRFRPGMVQTLGQLLTLAHAIEALQS